MPRGIRRGASVVAMPHGSHERPATHRAWRWATPAVVLLSGLLFAVSAERSDGSDLRGGRFTDLASVVKAESDNTTRLTNRVAELNTEIDELSAALGDRSVLKAQRETARLSYPAGLTPVTGPAVQVTLDDASPEAQEAYAGDPNDLVIHQQDIQAVANAMWRAGARAVTIQGQRVISTTGIKCEGSTVTLHGVPYAPPYVIVAIGDQVAIQESLAGDDYLEIFRSYVGLEGTGVGYEVLDLDQATAPAFDGLLDLTWAQPIEG